jgi:hypothetical protein
MSIAVSKCLSPFQNVYRRFKMFVTISKCLSPFQNVCHHFKMFVTCSKYRKLLIPPEEYCVQSEGKVTLVHAMNMHALK